MFATCEILSQLSPWRIAALIGLVQGVAVLPGISRAGVTIAAGVIIGMPRERAVEFSFLLSIPTIIGALGLTIGDDLATHISSTDALLGMAIAFGVGLVCLRLLLGIVRRGRLVWFAPYLTVAGAVAIAISHG